MVKIYKRGAFIEAYYNKKNNKTIENDIMKRNRRDFSKR